MINRADRKADSAALFDSLDRQLNAMTAMRTKAREAGLEMPDAARRVILRQLCDADKSARVYFVESRPKVPQKATATAENGHRGSLPGGRVSVCVVVSRVTAAVVLAGHLALKIRCLISGTCLQVIARWRTVPVSLTAGLERSPCSRSTPFMAGQGEPGNGSTDVPLEKSL